MKSILFAIAILFAVSPTFSQTATLAPPKEKVTKAVKQQAQQTKASAEDRAQQYTNELKKKLNLSPDQVVKVQAVNAECIRRKDALKANGTQGGSGFKDISIYRKQQFAGILTPAQMTQLNAMNAASSGGKGSKSNTTGGGDNSPSPNNNN